MINIHIETKMELVTKDGKRFSLFSDIAFRIRNKKTGNLDLIIGRIVGMTDSDYKKDNGYIVIDEVEINRCECGENHDVFLYYFKDMLDINYVYDD